VCVCVCLYVCMNVFVCDKEEERTFKIENTQRNDTAQMLIILPRQQTGAADYNTSYSTQALVKTASDMTYLHNYACIQLEGRGAECCELRYLPLQRALRGRVPCQRWGMLPLQVYFRLLRERVQ